MAYEIMNHRINASDLHFNAQTIEEALDLLSQYRGEAKIIAGGADLIRLMKQEIIAPCVLVNIKTIPELTGITRDANGLKIGALTRIGAIEQSPLIKANYRLLAEAAHAIASPHLRNMGTVAGNLCQEVNCWYYRRPTGTGVDYFCIRRGGEQCFAVSGDNRYHAILGSSRCFAVCPSDMATALTALNARIKIVGSGGERELATETLYTPLALTLKQDEIITGITVPEPEDGTVQKFIKFRIRKAIDFAIVSVASALTLKDGIVSRARIIVGGVAPYPYRARHCEEVLQGKPVIDALAEEAANVALSDAVPLNMNRYKLRLTEVLVKRAILGSTI